MTETVRSFSSEDTPGRSASTYATVPDAFRAVAAQHADRLALHERQQSFTYAQVDEASNQVANRLLDRDDAGRPLVLVAPVSVESIVMIVGALKAGRLAAPLEPRWPPEKWAEVTRRMDGRLVVPDEATRTTLGPRLAADSLTFAELRTGSTEDPRVDLDPAAPTGVFFTSGSTGAPKGTLVGHEAAVRALDRFVLPVDERLALLAPLGYITGGSAAIGVLLTGASGHIFDLAGSEPAALPDWIDERGITILGLTTTMVSLIARTVIEQHRTLDSLRVVSLAGEACTAQDFEDARRAFPNATFRHSYGLTETGAVAVYEVGSLVDPPGTALPVGYPLPSVTVEIVDPSGEPVAAGEAGEIWVSGDQLALGYWDEPLLTAERFVEHPDGSRTVRTGDRGRLRPDGMLELLGRLDRQVKVNGQLVDLTAVEQEVKLLGPVHDSVVSAVPTADRGYRVVAHVVVDNSRSVTVGELRRGLADRLPPYAVPRAFFRVNDIPQTVSGKADRAWLRESAIGALPLETEFVAARDECEVAVAGLFSEVLGLDRVGIHDDFFELGGDSLSVLDLLAGIHDQFGLELTPNELLLGATVEAVAERLRHGVPTTGRTLVPVTTGTERPLFCVPGAADTPVQYRPLGRRLGGVPLYSFTYHGMDHRALPDYSIAAIVRRNLAALREVEPLGPYRILGYSIGGTIAFEMARQLELSGDEVELLALLEPALPASLPSSPRRVEPAQRVRRLHERALETHPGDDRRSQARRMRAQARWIANFVRRQLYINSAGIVARTGIAQHDVFLYHLTRLLGTYRPGPFHGPALVFGSQHYLEGAEAALDHLLPSEHRGGRRRDVVVPGKHLDLVREPNVAEVARALDACFDDADALRASQSAGQT